MQTISHMTTSYITVTVTDDDGVVLGAAVTVSCQSLTPPGWPLALSEVGSGQYGGTIAHDAGFARSARYELKVTVNAGTSTATHYIPILCEASLS